MHRGMNRTGAIVATSAFVATGVLGAPPVVTTQNAAGPAPARAAAISPAAPDAPGDFYLLDNNFNPPGADGFYRSNLASVATVSLVRAYPDYYWADLAPSDVNGQLFGARLPAAGGGNTTLVRIRQSDGEVVSELPLTAEVASLAFDRSTGKLYGADENLTLTVYEIDRQTGVATPIGPGLPGLFALVFDPETGALFATSGTTLHRRDMVTGQWQLVGTHGHVMGFGLAWNPADHQLYLTDAWLDSLFRVDRATAQTTPMGGTYTQARFATGLSFANVVCVPDCDGNGTLNVNDYICFQTKFAIGDPYADCDGNGVRNVNDYICFQTAFALGC